MFCRTGIVLSALALGLTLAVPQANADVWNKKTVITVRETLRIPTTTLQPGKYVLKLAESASNRHIVQIFNEDESQVLATILAIPNERLEPTGDTVLELWETPKGEARALRAWFYPGDSFGQEFAYPKAEATALTAEVHQEVPALSAEDEAALASRSTNSSGSEVAANRPETAAPAQPSALDDSTREMARTDNESTPPPAPETHSSASDMSSSSSDQSASEKQDSSGMATEETSGAHSAYAGSELPRTASFLPLLGLTGLLAVGAATVLRAASGR